MENIGSWVLGCCGSAIFAMVLLFVLPNIIINRNARTWALKNASGYLTGLRDGDASAAAGFVSKLVLSDETEKAAWIAKMVDQFKTGRLVEFELGRPEFRTMRGNYTGEVYIEAHAKYGTGTSQRKTDFTLKLVEDENHESETIRVCDAPELAEEAKQRLVVHPLLLRPTRRAADESQGPTPGGPASLPGTTRGALVADLTEAAQGMAEAHFLPERQAVARVDNEPMTLEARCGKKLAESYPGFPEGLGGSSLIESTSAASVRFVTPEYLAQRMSGDPQAVSGLMAQLPPETLAPLPLPPDQRKLMDQQRERATAVWLELLADPGAPKDRVEHWHAFAVSLLLLLAVDASLQSRP